MTNTPLQERLKDFAPRFLQIRETMGVTPAVGLGVFPQVKMPYTYAALLYCQVKHSACDGAVLIHEHGVERYSFFLPNAGVIDPDVLCKGVAFVCVNYPLPGICDHVQYGSLSDEVLSGFVAHEFAHWLERHGEPLDPKQALETRVIRDIQHLSPGVGQITLLSNWAVCQEPPAKAGGVK